MDNWTYNNIFYLVPFSAKPNYSSFIFVVFFLLYIFGILINTIIITVIYLDDQLHTPMYLFLCNLALVDICYITITVPNLLYMLLSGDNTVSFIKCFTQMYFYLLAGSTEDVIIFIMAYDRYAAICHPLHYHNILTIKKCLVFAISAWVAGGLNSVILTSRVSHMTFCHSHTIHQFFCDAKALIDISCTDSKNFYIIFCVVVLIFVFYPFVIVVTSYIKIIRVILQIKSNDGRKKAFSTCSSHLIMIIIYYVTALSVYMMPASKYSNVLEPVFTVLYAVVTPMINPLIYSLRNKDMKRALMRLMGVNLSTE